MNWFKFLTTERQYNVSLIRVAKEFDMSIDYIEDLLIDAGYDLIGSPFVRLNNDHLEIISRAYISSIKSYYKESSKYFSSYTRDEQIGLRAFFKRFIRTSFFNPSITLEINGKFQLAKNSRIFSENLDSELIRNHFFEIIDRLEIGELYRDLERDFNVNVIITNYDSRPDFIFREVKWKKVKIKHSFNDIKSRIFTTIITGHYYIFSCEEDLSTAILSSVERCFSAVKIKLGEALKFNNSNFNLLWKLIYNLSLRELKPQTYQIMIKQF